MSETEIDSGASRLHHRLTRTVTEDDCATRWGNTDLYVLSTPAILGTMEQACVAALTPSLASGQLTVGIHVDLHHTAAALVGDEVTYEVQLSRRDRFIQVEFTVTDDNQTVISHGTHRRAIIDQDRFLEKLRTVRRPPR